LSFFYSRLSSVLTLFGRPPGPVQSRRGVQGDSTGLNELALNSEHVQLCSCCATILFVA